MKLSRLILPKFRLLLLCAALAACGQEKGGNADNTPPAASRPQTAASVPAVQAAEPKTAGDFDFPVIPEIMVPDFLGTSPVQAQIEKIMPQLQDPIKGLNIQAAECAADGKFRGVRGGLTRHTDDGGFSHVGQEGIFRVNPDGSGTANFPGGIIRVNADGSGTINGENGAIIRVNADGSGSYNGPLGIIRLDGKGGGTWNSDQYGIIRNNGDGSGTWNGNQGIIRINADGSGTWNGSPAGLVRNGGKGKGRVGTPGKEVAMAPIPPLPPAGRFPPLKTLAMPAAPCGFVITLGEQVLFDFDKDNIRSDAATILDTLAGALLQVEGIKKLEIGGHTDAKGSDAYNLDLSDRRAAAVAAALKQRSVNLAMENAGYGESRPVAPNEINGKDNPAGRQQNRRVEIFVRI